MTAGCGACARTFRRQAAWAAAPPRRQLPAPRVPVDQSARQDLVGARRPTSSRATGPARSCRLTDVRFVDTGAFAAKSDDVSASSWAASSARSTSSAEAQKVEVNAYAPGTFRAASTLSPAARLLARRSELHSRVCRSRRVPDRRNPRLQGRQVGPHQGAQAVQPGRLGRAPDQRPARLSRPRTTLASLHRHFTTGAPRLVPGNGGTQTGYQAER